jgi:hypothetical protein
MGCFSWKQDKHCQCNDDKERLLQGRGSSTNRHVQIHAIDAEDHSSDAGVAGCQQQARDQFHDSANRAMQARDVKGGR